MDVKHVLRSSAWRYKSLREPLDTPRHAPLTSVFNSARFPSVKRDPAVDYQGLTGDGIGAAKQHDLARDILEACSAFQDGFLLQRRNRFRPQSCGHLSSLHQTGGHTVHRDRRCKCHREATREMDQTRLRYCQSDAAAHRYEPGETRDIDDPALILLL